MYCVDSEVGSLSNLYPKRNKKTPEIATPASFLTKMAVSAFSGPLWDIYSRRIGNQRCHTHICGISIFAIFNFGEARKKWRNIQRQLNTQFAIFTV